MKPQELPLRDIHLPAPIGWWPPAPGWWVLLALLLGLALLLLWLWKKRRARRQADWFRLAEAELGRLQARHRDDPLSLLRELSVLLRRVAISRYGRGEVAGLTGAAWLDFLDKKAGKKLFKGKFDRLLTEMPYRASAEAETRALIVAIHEWLQLQRGNGHV
jgi:hypothetical protein